MLTYKLTNTNTFDPISNTLLLKDSTVYTQEESRDRFAMFVLGVYRTSTGDEYLTYEYQNPIDDTDYYIKLQKDGWYTFYLVALPKTSANIIYYNIVNNKMYKQQQEITLKELIGTNYIVSVTECFHVANNSKVGLLLQEKVNNLRFDGKDSLDKEIVRYLGNYQVVTGITRGAIYEFCRGNKYVAQKNIEYLNTNDYVL